MRSPEVEVAQPIVFADQKLRKIFVMNSDRIGVVAPEDLELKDKLGNVVTVPTNLTSGMTVMDVKEVKSGGYFLNVHGVTESTIRIVLF